MIKKSLRWGREMANGWLDLLTDMSARTKKDKARPLINRGGDEILVHQDDIAARVRENFAVAKDSEVLKQEKNRAEDALWDGDK